MSTVAFDPLSEQLLAAAREREATALTRAERRTYWSASVGFALLAFAMLVFGRHGEMPEPWVVAVLVCAYALAARLEFEVGSTLAIPTQLVLVEMLFLLPPSQLPLWIVAGSLLSQLPEYARRRVPPERMLIVVGSSWYAFGPALVVSLFPVEPSMTWRTLVVLAAALASQFLVDLASSCVREWAALRVPPRQLVSQLPLVFAIDLTLAPLGLLAAIAALHDQLALILPLPLLFLVSLSTRERQRRSTRRSSSRAPTAAPPSCSATSSRPTTPTRARTAATCSSSCSRSATSCGSTRASRLNAEFAALLHDVGKISVPAEIINKPGPLSPDEREVMNTHTLEGERLLAAGRRSAHRSRAASSAPATSAGTAAAIQTGSQARKSRSLHGSSAAATPSAP